MTKPGCCTLRQLPRRRIRFMPGVERHFDKCPAEACRAFTDCRKGQSAWPLMIHGDVGTGKTRFALLACDWYGGRFTTFTEVCDELRLCKLGELRDERYEVRPVMREAHWTKLLIEYSLVTVDDIGVCQDTERGHARDTLMRILNNRECLPLVLVSNLSLKEISEIYDDRIASRMAAGTVVNISGPDRRIES